MSIWHLYLVRCRDGSLYTGIATNVARRFAEHQGKGESGAKYLRGRGPLKLVFQKELGSRSLASKVEAEVKKLPKARKEQLVQSGDYIRAIIERAGNADCIRQI